MGFLFHELRLSDTGNPGAGGLCRKITPGFLIMFLLLSAEKSSIELQEYAKNI